MMRAAIRMVTFSVCLLGACLLHVKAVRSQNAGGTQVVGKCAVCVKRFDDTGLVEVLQVSSSIMGQSMRPIPAGRENFRMLVTSVDDEGIEDYGVAKVEAILRPLIKSKARISYQEPLVLQGVSSGKNASDQGPAVKTYLSTGTGFLIVPNGPKLQCTLLVADEASFVRADAAKAKAQNLPPLGVQQYITIINKGREEKARVLTEFQLKAAEVQARREQAAATREQAAAERRAAAAADDAANASRLAAAAADRMADEAATLRREIQFHR